MSKILLTVGSFDCFHVGHVNLLRRCREMAGRVVVAVNTDAFIERFKGHPPIINQRERMAVVGACRYVDGVISNIGDEDGGRVIEWVKPDILAIGDDWAPPRDYYAQMGITKDWLVGQGVELRFLGRTEGISTTIIRGRLQGEASSRR